jgi:PAS domain S-box-containing protein
MHIILVIIIFVLAVGIITMAIIYFSRIDKLINRSDSKPRDITGNKEQLADIFSSIEDGLVLIDDKSTIGLFNPSVAVLTGWNVEDAIGIDVDVVIRLADDKGNLYAGSSYPFNKVFASGQSIRDNTTELVTRDNKRFSVGLSISPLKDETGKITGAVGLIRNITQEKEQENRLADFISTASHEMRTPVAAIEGYLALALNNKVATIDNKAREYLQKAEEATRHLGTLFQDLLTSAKAEDGRLTSHPRVVDIGDMLRQLTEELKFIADKHNLETEFIIGSSSVVKSAVIVESERNISPLYYSYVDPDRMREVITNLYDNAVKYTPQGKITIGLTGNDQVVQFYIKDTGSGIPREDIPHLFQKFYRVDNSATRTIGGTGLGLFICRKIVELYNGRIWVESEAGKGSTFFINVPRLSTQKAQELLDNKNNQNIIPADSNSLART